jgi:hypothetical protein
MSLGPNEVGRAHLNQKETMETIAKKAIIDAMDEYLATENPNIRYYKHDVVVGTPPDKRVMDLVAETYHLQGWKYAKCYVSEKKTEEINFHVCVELGS